ncbi:MAG: hypothetical protein KBD37_01395 [Burkholderiales bacterium]|nr:hypothetical protein [Burkholderiales bacterium]
MHGIRKSGERSFARIGSSNNDSQIKERSNLVRVESTGIEVREYFNPQQKRMFPIPKSEPLVINQKDMLANNLHGFMKAILARDYKEIDISSYTAELIATVLVIKSVLTALMQIKPYIQQKLFLIGKDTNNNVYARIEENEIQVAMVIGHEDITLVSPQQSQQVLNNLNNFWKSPRIQQETLRQEIVKLLYQSKDYYTNKIKSDQSGDIFKCRAVYILVIAEIFKCAVNFLDDNGKKDAAIACVEASETIEQILKKYPSNNDLHITAYNYHLLGLELHEKFRGNDIYKQQRADIYIKRANLLKQLHLNISSKEDTDRGLLDKVITETCNSYSYGISLYEELAAQLVTPQEIARIELLIASLKLEAMLFDITLENGSATNKVFTLVNLYFDKAQKSIAYMKLEGKVDRRDIVNCLKHAQNIYVNFIEALPVTDESETFDQIIEGFKYISNFYIQHFNRHTIAAKKKFLFGNIVLKKIEEYHKQEKSLTLHCLNNSIRLLEYAKTEYESGIALVENDTGLSAKKLLILERINKKIQELKKLDQNNKFQGVPANWVTRLESSKKELQLSQDLRNFLNAILSSESINGVSVTHDRNIITIFSMMYVFAGIINQYKVFPKDVSRKFLIHMYENTRIYAVLSNTNIKIKILIVGHEQIEINLGGRGLLEVTLTNLEKFCSNKDIQKKLSHESIKAIVMELAIFHLKNAISTYDVDRPQLFKVSLIYYDLGIDMLQYIHEPHLNNFSPQINTDIAKKYAEAGGAILQLHLKLIRSSYDDLASKGGDFGDELLTSEYPFNSKLLIDKCILFCKYSAQFDLQLVNHQIAIIMDKIYRVEIDLAESYMKTKSNILQQQDIKFNYISKTYRTNRDEYIKTVKRFITLRNYIIINVWNKLNQEIAQQANNLFNQLIDELIDKCEHNNNFDDIASIYEEFAIENYKKHLSNVKEYIDQASKYYNIHYENTLQYYKSFLGYDNSQIATSTVICYKINIIYLYEEKIRKCILYDRLLGQNIYAAQVNKYVKDAQDELFQVIDLFRNCDDSTLIDLIIMSVKDIFAICKEVETGKFVVDMQLSLANSLYEKVIVYHTTNPYKLITTDEIKNRLKDFNNSVKLLKCIKYELENSKKFIKNEQITPNQVDRKVEEIGKIINNLEQSLRSG